MFKFIVLHREVAMRCQIATHLRNERQLEVKLVGRLAHRVGSLLLQSKEIESFVSGRYQATKIRICGRGDYSLAFATAELEFCPLVDVSNIEHL